MTDRASSASAAPGDAVRAWSDRVVIPTYPTFPPERSPFFLERRVYQGSSGRVYPNPVTDRVSGEKVDRAYLAVHLEKARLTAAAPDATQPSVFEQFRPNDASS